MRYLSDFGAAGPDKGKGGKYLVLPPGYTGDVPEGYFVVKSTSNVVWNFMRGYVRGSVQDPANVKKASDNILENLKVYPLAKKDDPPKTEFINMTGVHYNTVPPERLQLLRATPTRSVQKEPISLHRARQTRGLIAAIGIVKGKPFKPQCADEEAAPPKPSPSAMPTPGPTRYSRVTPGSVYTARTASG